MAFCHLTGGQTAALMVIVGAMASPNTKETIKKLIRDKDWRTLQIVFSLASGPGVTVPSEDDFRVVGDMRPGLQNAYLLLALIDAKATDDAKGKLQDALDTHCWGEVAKALVEALKENGLNFDGRDLREAYAPNDNEPCKGPNWWQQALLEAIKDGKLVGNFFSQKLPDFFEHDFTNFFKDAVPGFFKGPFADFFKDIGGEMQKGFNDLKGKVDDALDELNPSRW